MMPMGHVIQLGQTLLRDVKQFECSFNRILGSAIYIVIHILQALKKQRTFSQVL